MLKNIFNDKFSKKGEKSFVVFKCITPALGQVQGILAVFKAPPCDYKLHQSAFDTVITLNLYDIKTLQFIRRADKVKQKLKIFAATVQCTATRKKILKFFLFLTEQKKKF